MCIIIIIIASPYVQDKWGLNLSVTLYFKVQFLLLKNINYDFCLKLLICFLWAN